MIEAATQPQDTESPSHVLKSVADLVSRFEQLANKGGHFSQLLYTYGRAFVLISLMNIGIPASACCTEWLGLAIVKARCLSSLYHS